MMTMHQNQDVRRGEIVRGRQAGRTVARLAPARTDGQAALRHVISILSAITNATVLLPLLIPPPPFAHPLE
jgi:antitoxin (DNA-binding transcriptional repressor) of toxin-antitoxin stability system